MAHSPNPSHALDQLHCASALSPRFAIVKLLDLAPRLPALLEAGNGFALFAAAHLEIM